MSRSQFIRKIIEEGCEANLRSLSCDCAGVLQISQNLLLRLNDVVRCSVYEDRNEASAVGAPKMLHSQLPT